MEDRRTRTREQQLDDLDAMRDAFKTWDSFPCNAKGNTFSADKERDEMLAAMRALERGM